METVIPATKKMLKLTSHTSNEVLRQALSAEINRLYAELRAYGTDEYSVKRHPKYADYCELSRRYYAKQRELQELNENDLLFQSELKMLNDKANIADTNFYKKKNFITE